MNLGEPVSLGFDIGGTNIRGIALRPDFSFGEMILHPCEDDQEKIIRTVVKLTDQIQEKEAEETAVDDRGEEAHEEYNQS